MICPSEPPIIGSDILMKAEKLEKATALVYLGNYSKSIDISNQVLNPTNLDGSEIKAIALMYMGKQMLL